MGCNSAFKGLRMTMYMLYDLLYIYAKIFINPYKVYINWATTITAYWFVKSIVHRSLSPVPTISAVGSSMPHEVLRLLSSPSGDQMQPTLQFLLLLLLLLLLPLHNIISLWTRTGLRNIIMTCSPPYREVWSQIILSILVPLCGRSVCTWRNVSTDCELYLEIQRKDWQNYA
jgi:hypothetical protein